MTHFFSLSIGIQRQYLLTKLHPLFIRWSIVSILLNLFLEASLTKRLTLEGALAFQINLAWKMGTASSMISSRI